MPSAVCVVVVRQSTSAAMRRRCLGITSSPSMVCGSRLREVSTATTLVIPHSDLALPSPWWLCGVCCVVSAEYSDFMKVVYEMVAIINERAGQSRDPINNAQPSQPSQPIHLPPPLPMQGNAQPNSTGQAQRIYMSAEESMSR